LRGIVLSGRNRRLRRQDRHCGRDPLELPLGELKPVMQPHDLQLGPQVDTLVVLGGLPVPRGLSVLAHQDHRSLHRGQGRQD
jgi:hypothetical protein